MALYPLYINDVVRISGEGAHKLINDTLTCRFDDSLEGRGRWFALLSPQGKILISGLATKQGDAWFFDMEAGLVADFVKRMKLYRMRAKAEIEHMPNYAVFWSDNESAPRNVVASYIDERAEGLGRRFISDWGDNRPTEAPTEDPLTAYNRVRVAAGVPDYGADFGANDAFAHDIGLDLLDGIDFAKGCYVGQEVVSRMKHRGTARRRPVIVSGIEGEAGQAVMANGREAGTVGQVVDGRAVAIVRLDRITDPAAVTVGGRPVHIELPVWANYRLGDAIAEDE